MSKDVNKYFSSSIFIGPPGTGKTRWEKSYPKLFLDPESSIDWSRINSIYNIYPKKRRGVSIGGSKVAFEYEIKWANVWIDEVLIRILTGFFLQKDVLMGIVTPTDIEVVNTFLKSFLDKVKILIPNKEEHWSRFWKDINRPKTWSNHLLTWQHTLSLRLLLVGLANNLNIPIITRLHIKTRRKNLVKLPKREAFWNKRRFIEGINGRWVEINSDRNIVAIYKSCTRENGLNLICDKSSQMCCDKNHDCSNKIFLKLDSEGKLLSEWISTQKLNLDFKNNLKNAVIFFTGTLAPIHRGHIGILEGAKKYLESNGWNIIGGYISPLVNLKKRRLGQLDHALKDVNHRSTMVLLSILRNSWLMDDFPIDNLLDKSLLEKDGHPIQKIYQRLLYQKVLPTDLPITTFWVNGTDGLLDIDFFSKLASCSNKNSMNPLRLLIVKNRKNKNNWSTKNILKNVPELEDIIDRHTLPSKKQTSAGEVRAALVKGNRKKVSDKVGIPSVEAYLMGLMYHLY